MAIPKLLIRFAKSISSCPTANPAFGTILPSLSTSTNPFLNAICKVALCLLREAKLPSASITSKSKALRASFNLIENSFAHGDFKLLGDLKVNISLSAWLDLAAS